LGNSEKGQKNIKFLSLFSSLFLQGVWRSKKAREKVLRLKAEKEKLREEAAAIKVQVGKLNIRRKNLLSYKEKSDEALKLFLLHHV